MYNVRFSISNSRLSLNFKAMNQQKIENGSEIVKL